MIGIGSPAARQTAYADPHRIPSDAIILTPGEDLRRIVTANPPRSTFYLKDGVYRLQTITPRTGDTFIGSRNAVLNGSKLLTNFVHSGRYWYAPDQFQQSGSPVGTCDKNYPRCNYPQDLFLDNLPLEHVNSLDAVIPGTWYFDYINHRIYLADSPNGHCIEISTAAYAFLGNANDVTITGLTIEKYANAAQTGAINAILPSEPYSRGWTVENSEIRLNHGGGIVMGSEMHVLRNFIHHNGQIGLGAGGGSNSIVDSNEISYNNTAHYSADWEAGGTKFHNTDNLTLSWNHVHNNRGPGLWCDGDNTHVLYENNHTNNNVGAGILHEVSFDAVIRDNLVENDGYSLNGKTSLWWGAGILVTNSSNVEIYGNTLKRCMNGVGAVLMARGASKRFNVPYVVKNLSVHDNILVQDIGTVAGIVRNFYGTSVFSIWNNRWRHNIYVLSNREATATAYQWMDGARTKDQWQSYGNDVDGTWRIAAK